jgi:hypothetical protein
MSLGEIGGGVDLMLRYKLMGDVDFTQEPWRVMPWFSRLHILS